MGFVGVTSEYSMSGYTVLDNIFVSEYMPYAPEHCVRVYVYGLFCALSSPNDSTIEGMGKVLSLDANAIRDAYSYWQGCGLIRITNTSPLEVKYLPAKSGYTAKKYPASKYSSFNDALSSIITGRMISTNEFYQYYTAIETHNIEPSAMVMIAKYCASIKGTDINYPYVLAVARAWAAQGVTTVRAVEERLKTFELTESDIGEVCKALSLKRKPDVEERQLYQKFVSEYGFNKDSIVYAAKKCKKGGFARLDRLLTEYYSARVIDVTEIEEFDKNKDELYTLCRAVTRLIGVRYEQLDNVVDTYILPWVNKGFEPDALKMIADNCFKNNIRTLEGMNDAVTKLFKQGLVTPDALRGYLSRVSESNALIKEVLEITGITRAVNSWDRDAYRTWTYTWKFSHEIVLEAARLASGKAGPIAYMNRILSDWRDKGVKTLEDIKKQPTEKPAPKRSFDRAYTKEEWAAMLDDLNNIEY